MLKLQGLPCSSLATPNLYQFLGRIFLVRQGPTCRDMPDPKAGMSWTKTMCFLTVSSKPCLEALTHSILQTPLIGHCLGALRGVRPCLANRVWRHSSAIFSRQDLLDIVWIHVENFMQGAFFCCFRQGMARTSRDLGRHVPESEKLYARKLWADFFAPYTSSGQDS